MNILKEYKAPRNLKSKLPNIKSTEKTFSVKMKLFCLHRKIHHNPL